MSLRRLSASLRHVLPLGTSLRPLDPLATHAASHLQRRAPEEMGLPPAPAPLGDRAVAPPRSLQDLTDPDHIHLPESSR